MRVCTFLIVVSLSLLLLAFWSAVPAHAALSWSVQIVDANASGIGNGYCPIAVDSNNTSHIAYVRNIYASWNGSGWSTQEISNYGSVTDLALDADGNPHVLIERGVLGPLSYASWTGTEWTTQTVASTLNHNVVYASLALDSAGNPHAAYTYGEGLEYASCTGSTWNIQTVDPSPDINIDVSLALDSNDTPYILYATPSSYHDATTGQDYQTVNVKLAVFKNSTWGIQTVPLPPPIGGSSNLFLDSKGYPHFIGTQIHYRSSEDVNLVYTLLYVSWDGTAWTTQMVVSNIVAEDYIVPGVGFLSLDSHDSPHFASFIGAASRLLYASWTGNSWDTQTVNPGYSAYGPVYLALDSNGIPHISFRGYIPGQLNGQSNATIFYATATVFTESTQPSSPTSPASPVLLVSVAVIIGAVVTVVVYVWKKKT